MRIVSGINKGRILSSPAGLTTRPTSDRARQAIFNILAHGNWMPAGLLETATALDAYAGTGAMGLEALSRGAAEAVFIDNDRNALAACRKNIADLGHGAVSTVLAQDVTRITPRPQQLAPRSLVFLDPPYGADLGLKALHTLVAGGWLVSGAVCVMEMAKKQPEPEAPGFTLHDTRNYGVAMVRFLTYSG